MKTEEDKIKDGMKKMYALVKRLKNLGYNFEELLPILSITTTDLIYANTENYKQAKGMIESVSKYSINYVKSISNK